MAPCVQNHRRRRPCLGRDWASGRICEPFLAIPAKTAADVKGEAETVVDLYLIHRIANLDGYPRVIMTKDWSSLHVASAFIHVQIRTTDTNGRNFDQDVGSVFSLGIWRFFIDDFPRSSDTRAFILFSVETD